MTIEEKRLRVALANALALQDNLPAQRKLILAALAGVEIKTVRCRAFFEGGRPVVVA